MRLRQSIGRVVLAVVGGYSANGILVVGTEELLWLFAHRAGAPPPYYFVTDLISQCIYTVVGGYLCRLIARSSEKAALTGLISLGMLVGTGSLLASWKTEPHWYGIALLAVYPLCVWAGWALKDRAHGQSFPRA